MTTAHSLGKSENRSASLDQLRSWQSSSTTLRLDLVSSPGARMMQVDVLVTGVTDSAVGFSWSLNTPPFVHSSGTLEVFIDSALLFMASEPPRVTIQHGQHSCVLRELLV